MKITNIRVEKRGDLTVACASIAWEEQSSPRENEIYFGTSPEFASDLTAGPEAFLLGCLMPAIHLGEKRIQIDGKICPVLKQGILRNLKIFSGWFGRKYRDISIEAGSKALGSIANEKRMGLFLSGGVDSLYSLRMNRLKMPRPDPLAVKDCFLIYGLDIGFERVSSENLSVFSRAVDSLRDVAADAQVALIPVYTNIRRLHNDVLFWQRSFHGAALAAVAHCFTRRIGRVLVASSHTPDDLDPWGSHPLIDPNYSSQALQVAHDRLVSRFEKTKVIAEWEPALHHMRVCTSNKEDLLNCCKCRKCLRTMIHLLALDKLEASKAFAIKDIAVTDFRDVVRNADYPEIKVHYLPVVEALRRKGRMDLVDIILGDTDWKAKIRLWDKFYFKGYLTQGWDHLRRTTLTPVS